MNGQGYLFRHPQYGVLRVINTPCGVFYSLEDIMRHYKKSGREVFEAIADSTGMVISCTVKEVAHSKVVIPFLFHEELGEHTDLKNNTPWERREMFIDMQLVKDLETTLTPEAKLVYRWVHHFVEFIMKLPLCSERYACDGKLKITFSPFGSPMSVIYGEKGLIVNDLWCGK